jgi:hypothetical protein
VANRIPAECNMLTRKEADVDRDDTHRNTSTRIETDMLCCYSSLKYFHTTLTPNLSCSTYSPKTPPLPTSKPQPTQAHLVHIGWSNIQPQYVVQCTHIPQQRCRHESLTFSNSSTLIHSQQSIRNQKQQAPSITHHARHPIQRPNQRLRKRQGSSHPRISGTSYPRISDPGCPRRISGPSRPRFSSPSCPRRSSGPTRCRNSHQCFAAAREGQY